MPHPTLRRRSLSLAVLLASLPALAPAQSAWPAKPVKLIVPFAPGGPTDTVARLLAERLQAQWQQPVVMDYKPGAGTVVGTDFVAKSAPELARKIAADIGTAVKSPEMAARMATLGLEAVGSSPEQYSAVIRTEIDKWGKLIKTANITLE